MDAKTNKVLDINIVHVKEVKNSQGMEKEGFIQTINRLENHFGITIRVVSTDRHIQIRKMMQTSPRYKHIIHQFDPWHMAKNVNKNLMKLGKKTGNRSLLPWIPHIINHLYWSIQTCNGNGQELRERFLSVIHHVVNRHQFTGNTFYLTCDHEEYSRKEQDERQWLKMGGKAHSALKSVILKPQFTKDIAKMNESIFTTYLEVFHSLKIRYVPKSTFFEKDKMVSSIGPQPQHRQKTSSDKKEERRTTHSAI
jgi:hypothetical protein